MFNFIENIRARKEINELYDVKAISDLTEESIIMISVYTESILNYGLNDVKVNDEYELYEFYEELLVPMNELAKILYENEIYNEPLYAALVRISDILETMFPYPSQDKITAKVFSVLYEVNLLRNRREIFKRVRIKKRNNKWCISEKRWV